MSWQVVAIIGLVLATIWMFVVLLIVMVKAHVTEMLCETDKHVSDNERIVRTTSRDLFGNVRTLPTDQPRRGA